MKFRVRRRNGAGRRRGAVDLVQKVKETSTSAGRKETMSGFTAPVGTQL